MTTTSHSWDQERWRKHDVRTALAFLEGTPQEYIGYYWTVAVAKQIIKAFTPEGEDPLEWSTRP